MFPMGILVLLFEEDFPLGNVDFCLERNRILGASVVRYSTGVPSLLNFGNFSRPLFF